MTDDEKREQREARERAICAYYLEGHRCAEVASKFRLSRQRIQQILHKAGAWKPYVKGDRTKHLGIMVNDETHAALTEKAQKQGRSVSAMAAEQLEGFAKGAQ